ncbi:hypothetical protein PLESTF_001197000 [Pleodorina starrii]|nr:hypothetical protein PLESTF_001197000 [Pleodorina starrii]
MSDKLDVDVDVLQLANVEAEVLATLRVGQKLTLACKGEDDAIFLCTEAGVHLAPLSGNQQAARFPNPKVIIRAIKREVVSGALQKLQIRIYGSDGAGTGGADGLGAQAALGPGSAAAGAPAAAAGDAQASGAAEDEQDYKLRRAQYQALADSPELRTMLADPHLQSVLAKIDSAPDRERALQTQLETPSFQGFVSQVLMNLDPEGVPATTATAAAVAMATR